MNFNERKTSKAIRYFYLFFVSMLHLAVLSSASLSLAGTPPNAPRFSALNHEFTLNDGKAFDQWLDEIKNSETSVQLSQARVLGNAKLENLGDAELKAYFGSDTCRFSSDVKNGVKLLKKLSERLTITRSALEIEKLNNLATEAVYAIANACEPAFPLRADLVQVPFILYKFSHFKAGKGHEPASNLEGSNPDLSLRQPPNSNFWSRPDDMSSLNLYAGYGRNEIPLPDFKACEYVAPKTSSGTNAGFKVKCDGKTIKVKLGEAFSEPIASRLFWAFGYHAAMSDSVPEVTLPYARRILREFNMRRPIKTKITLLRFQKLKTYEISPVYDPFKFIKSATLTDGTKIDAAQLRKVLFYNPRMKHPEREPTNFKVEQEKRIAYLTFRNASLKYETGLEKKSIGSWEYNLFQHDNLRELRGLGMLAAWIGYADARAQNTHLIAAGDKEKFEVIHEISDSGDGLGKIAGVLGRDNGNKANEFLWRFTKPHNGGQGVEFTDFRTVDRNQAFKKMTIDDARWMARLIAQLSSEQIKAALIAGGLTSAEVTLYSAKLESRRNFMLRDLGLADLAATLTKPIDENLNYNPPVEGVVSVVLPDGSKVAAPVGEDRIENGILVGPYTHD